MLVMMMMKHDKLSHKCSFDNYILIYMYSSHILWEHNMNAGFHIHHKEER